MPRRKVKIEFTDNEGSKYTISLEGLASKDKLARIMEMVEELNANTTNVTKELTLNTTFNKTLKIIEDKFPLGTFTSNDVLEAYEDIYNSPIKPSTVSTYLARLYGRGHVEREQIGNVWAYRKNKIIMTR